MSFYIHTHTHPMFNSFATQALGAALVLFLVLFAFPPSAL